MAKNSPEHIRHHLNPRITANDLARYMVATETGKLGIIRRSRDSVTPPRIRYREVRPPICAYLSDPNRTKGIIFQARETFEQHADDISLKGFVREDARLSIDVLDSLMKMNNQLGGFGFVQAPAKQPKLMLGKVEVSVNVDLLLSRSKGPVEQVGGALLRLTKADDETEAAAAKRREVGAYAATLVHMHIAKHLAGNKQPFHGLCMSVDIQCEEVHLAPKTYAQKAQNLENACKFIAAMWSDA